MHKALAFSSPFLGIAGTILLFMGLLEAEMDSYTAGMALLLSVIAWFVLVLFRLIKLAAWTTGLKVLESLAVLIGSVFASSLLVLVGHLFGTGISPLAAAGLIALSWAGLLTATITSREGDVHAPQTFKHHDA